GCYPEDTSWLRGPANPGEIGVRVAIAAVRVGDDPVGPPADRIHVITPGRGPVAVGPPGRGYVRDADGRVESQTAIGRLGVIEVGDRRPGIFAAVVEEDVDVAEVVHVHGGLKFDARPVVVGDDDGGAPGQAAVGGTFQQGVSVAADVGRLP